MTGKPYREFDCAFYPGAVRYPHHCEIFGGFDDAERAREIRRGKGRQRRTVPHRYTRETTRARRQMEAAT